MIHKENNDFDVVRRGTLGRAQRALLAFLAVAAMSVSLLQAAPPEAAPKPSEPFGIYHAKFIEAGVLAAGQPTSAQLKELAKAGYGTDIDLRRPSEVRGFDEPQVAKEVGLAYVNIPVSLKLLDGAAIDRFIRAFDDAKRPVVVHCASSNRVGALYYAYLVEHKGVSPSEAMQRALKAGLHEQALIEKVRALVESSQAHQP